MTPRPYPYSLNASIGWIRSSRSVDATQASSPTMSGANARRPIVETMLPGSAPGALRRPISRLRFATVNDMSAYSPAADRSIATADRASGAIARYLIRTDSTSASPDSGIGRLRPRSRRKRVYLLGEGSARARTHPRRAKDDLFDSIWKPLTVPGAPGAGRGLIE